MVSSGGTVIVDIAQKNYTWTEIIQLPAQIIAYRQRVVAMQWSNGRHETEVKQAVCDIILFYI